jgi:regulator of protease activity HflC (stomatin/prohibitin superfamily)
MEVFMRSLIVILALGACAGCGAIVEPGHRALFFDTHHKGLHPEVLGPGHYSLGAYGRLEDFDVTYSTKKETLNTSSSEGLAIALNIAVIYRPIISELYELDNEVGRNYYDEVVGPEFRSTAQGVVARHSYADLQKQNEKIEDEVEVNLRRRVNGKHVEIASVVIESVEYAPEIWSAHRTRLVAELEAARQRAALENESLKEKLILRLRAEQEHLRLENEAAREDLMASIRAKRAAPPPAPPPARAPGDALPPAPRLSQQ